MTNHAAQSDPAHNPNFKRRWTDPPHCESLRSVGSAAAEVVADLRFRREVKDVPMTVVSAGPSGLSVDQCKSLGYQIILYIATVKVSLRAIRDTYLRVKESGYLPEVPEEKVDEMRNLTNTLLGFEEKWAVEAATTEAPRS